MPDPSLGRRGEELLDRFGDHPSLFFEGTWYRSGELASRARRAARGFVELGVRPGDRVVIVMANCPEVGLAYSALWRAGAVPTPALFLLTEDELRHVISDSGAVAVVTTPEFLPKVQAAAPGLPVVVVGQDWDELEAHVELPLVHRDGSDLAALLYTGGTTGRSKGVALSHAGLDAAGKAAADAAYSPGRTTGLLPLPLAHAYGLLVTVAGLHAHEPGKAFLMRWFDPAGWAALIQEHRIQTTALVPSMLQMILSLPLESLDLSCLERVSSGAAPLSADVLHEFERRIPSCEVREGYGCTESSALISTQPAEERKIGSVGKPVPGVTVRITLPDGTEAAPGQDGEICVGGSTLMQGYWNSPDATAFALREGWLHTGDVGHLDADGWLYIVDRIKDLIIRGGFNVYPRDVEDALLAHPAVAAAAVVGRPDPKLGEEVIAFVQLSGEVTPAELIAFAREHLGAYKYPREVRVVDAIPLTSVMKTDRKALRAQVAAEG
ncbi:MAG: putative O-succinylbenzoate--CoA ligase (menE) [Frankiales bacterium]|nr:putative O-succinylbenzoate--CoA ligase (menE) [Frankiales bacterium]